MTTQFRQLESLVALAPDGQIQVACDLWDDHTQDWMPNTVGLSIGGDGQLHAVDADGLDPLDLAGAPKWHANRVLNDLIAAVIQAGRGPNERYR